MTLKTCVRRLIPHQCKARLDYHRFPTLLNGWGGPLNGQCGRQQLVIDLMQAIRFTHIIETGTYRGTTTEYLARVSGLPTYSVELTKYNYHYARYRLRTFP